MGVVQYPELWDADWLAREYRAKTIYEIADGLGCAGASVYRALATHGIQMRSKPEQHRVARFRTRMCRECRGAFQPTAPYQPFCLPCRQARLVKPARPAERADLGGPVRRRRVAVRQPRPRLSGTVLRTDLDYLIGQARLRLQLLGPYQAVLPVIIPCALRLSAKAGSNGKVLNVRCQCMAGTLGIPSERFTGYDVLAEAKSLAEARLLWDEHVAARAQAPTR